MESINAPFTDEQVAALNDFQKSGLFHPFTCGGEHKRHVDLVATNDGWVCPDGCGYTQDWAHAMMADRDALARIKDGAFW